MLALLVIGLVVGVVSGLVGIGGGLLFVPLLHYGLNFSQHEAQGTTLAVLVPPIGIFAALEYYRRGFVRLPVVAFLALGFAVGAFVGAAFAGRVPAPTLKRGFGLLMFFVSVNMLFGSSQARSQALLPSGLATLAVGALAMADRRWGIGRATRQRLERWIRRRQPPSDSDGTVEYHI